ncbi:MAG: NifB/NifX family molybdenum-iron cluster-binding protein [Planctomycetota bacterium]
MIKLAIPHWQGRVSPVFDVAGRVLLVEIDGGQQQARQEFAFTAEDPRGRAARLAETGADVLVCGAISRPLEMALSAAGIEVIPQICGEVQRVLAAFIDGRLSGREFLMPGCCGQRRGGRHRCRHGQAIGHRGGRRGNWQR